MAVVQHRLARRLELGREAGLGRVAGGNGPAGQLPLIPEGGGHIVGQLAVPVGVAVPVEQGRVKGDAPAALGIVRIADDDRIPLDYRAHGFSLVEAVPSGWTVVMVGMKMRSTFFLARSRRLAVDQLGGGKQTVSEVTADRPSSYMGRVLLPDSWMRNPRLRQKAFQEGHGLPEGQHPGDADGDAPVGGQGWVRS